MQMQMMNISSILSATAVDLVTPKKAALENNLSRIQNITGGNNVRELRNKKYAGGVSIH